MHKIIYGINDFKSDLNNIGQKYSYIDIAKSDFSFYMSVSPRIIKIDDEQILIYEFSTVEKATKQVNLINKSGTAIGKYKSINWGDEPHFYKKYNIIVQYVGKNHKIINILDDILGVQFAGS